MKSFSDFERYFSEQTKEDTERLTMEVQKAVTENLGNIAPSVLMSVPGLVNIVCTAVCGGVLNMLQHYHEWMNNEQETAEKGR